MTKLINPLDLELTPPYTNGERTLAAYGYNKKHKYIKVGWELPQGFTGDGWAYCYNNAPDWIVEIPPKNHLI